MKTIIQKFWMVMAMLCLSISASAYDFEVDGIKYEIISLDDMTCKVIANTEKYAGIISIPASVIYNGRTFNVISIGNKAFLNCNGISELHLESATNLSEIGFSAFEGCTAINKVTIPSSCIRLGYNAFWGCLSLKYVIISESSKPLTLSPKDSNGSLSGTTLSYYFGHFADCPVEQLELLRDIKYGGWAEEFKELDSHWGNRITNVVYYPWINSCTKDLTIGGMVSKIPYNLLLTMNPTNLILEDGESPLNIEPLTTYKYYPYALDVYGEYSVNNDGYIAIKHEDGNEVHKFFWGFRFPALQHVYWGRLIETSEFVYNKIHKTIKEISLYSNSLAIFEYGKALNDIGKVSSVSSENLEKIIWNDRIEKCEVFGSTPNISELNFPNSLNKITGFASTGTLNNIYFGSELTELSGFGKSAVKDIYIKAITPPNLNEYSFNDNVFIDSKLHVPLGCKSVYSTSNVWRRFWNIIEEEDSGISDLESDENLDIIVNGSKLSIRGKADTDIVSVYNVQGQLVISTNDYEIELGNKGIFFIKIGPICRKIII